jgi:NADH:ubiquinone oxidoreductase subunit E
MKILSICVGRNCRLKNADKIFYYADQRIRDCHLSKEIDSKINLCTNHCEDGPIAYLNDKLIIQLAIKTIDDILDKA